VTIPRGYYSEVRHCERQEIHDECSFTNVLGTGQMSHPHHRSQHGITTPAIVDLCGQQPHGHGLLPRSGRKLSRVIVREIVLMQCSTAGQDLQEEFANPKGRDVQNFVTTLLAEAVTRLAVMYSRQSQLDYRLSHAPHRAIPFA
jgi:hypothetical protein